MLTDHNSIFSDTLPDRLLFTHTVPSASLRVAVIVPVRDEADHLPQTLDALRNQLTGNNTPIRPDLYEVLMLINNCTDASYSIAERYQREYPDFPLQLAQIQLPPQQANIGTVRRLLMDEACRRLQSVGNEQGIIASTDGDTLVDSQWLWAIMTEMETGCDAVAGRIITPPNGSPARLFHLRNVTYRQLTAQVEDRLDPCLHDPWPRHFQHFGASMAVTCRMYVQAGRLPHVPHLEDEAFYRALLRTDAKIRKSPLVKVFTSARLLGRVAVGFSEQLRYWTDMHHKQQVQFAEPPGALIVTFRNRYRLRVLWQERHVSPSDELLTAVARELCVPEQWLRQQLLISAYFGQLWEKVEKQMLLSEKWISQWQPIPITKAIHELRDYLRSLTTTTATVSQTDRAGTAPPVGPVRAAGIALQRLVPEKSHVPDRP